MQFIISFYVIWLDMYIGSECYPVYLPLDFCAYSLHYLFSNVSADSYDTATCDGHATWGKEEVLNWKANAMPKKKKVSNKDSMSNTQRAEVEEKFRVT